MGKVDGATGVVGLQTEHGTVGTDVPKDAVGERVRVGLVRERDVLVRPPVWGDHRGEGVEGGELGAVREGVVAKGMVEVG